MADHTRQQRTPRRTASTIRPSRRDWPGAEVDGTTLATTLARCRAAAKSDPEAATIISLIPENRRTIVAISVRTADWEIEETLEARPCGPRPAARRDIVLSSRGTAVIVRSARTSKNRGRPIEIRTPDPPIPAIDGSRMSAAARLPNGAWLIWRAAPHPELTHNTPKQLFTGRSLAFTTTHSQLLAALRDRAGPGDTALVYSSPLSIEVREDRRRLTAATTIRLTGEVRHDGAGAWRLLKPTVIARWLRGAPSGSTEASVVLYETRSEEDIGYLEQNVLVRLSPNGTACAVTLRRRDRQPL